MAPSKTLQRLLDEARKQIEVTDEELAEARRRRGLIADALRDEFPGCRVYLNGSVAHGDANTPLTDVDVGAVAFDEGGVYGPGKEGPRIPMERVRAAVKRRLGHDFPNLRVQVEGKRRAVLVSFGDPVTPGTEDFTADVVIGVDNMEGFGIFIPNLPEDGWDPANPEEHTRLVLEANRATGNVFARAIRLLKFWNLHHGKPVCSWALKVLAFPTIAAPMPLAEALQAVFTQACSVLRDGPLLDPATREAIRPNLALSEVLRRFDRARDLMSQAIVAEDEGRPYAAQHALSQLLPDIVPDADPDDLREEEAARLRSDEAQGIRRGVGTGVTTTLPSTRGWRP